MRQSWMVGRALRARRGGQGTARPTFPRYLFPVSPAHCIFLHFAVDIFCIKAYYWIVSMGKAMVESAGDRRDSARGRARRPARTAVPGLGVGPVISRLPVRSAHFQSAFRVIAAGKPAASRRCGLPAFLARHEISGSKPPSQFQLISDGFTCFQPVALPVPGKNRQTRHSWNCPVHPSSFARRLSSPVKPSQTQSNPVKPKWRLVEGSPLSTERQSNGPPHYRLDTSVSAIWAVSPLA